MKKLLFVLPLLACLSGHAEEAGVHRFATYNVRYVNASSGDSGEQLWANRREYVVKNITGFDFDVVGLEEVTGNNKDASTGKSQLQDLRDMLSAYADYSVEREGKNYSYNSIFYKKSKYTLRDKGFFYVNEHPDKPGTGWDGDISRTCIWLHLTDNESGQDFYFVCTHANFGATESGIQGAKLISQRISELAGQKPIILVGDFNMLRATHEDSYRWYASQFYDLALTAPQNKCLPEDGPQITATTTGWTPAVKNKNGSEYDYLFYKNMEPLSRHIITEYYPGSGRTVNPSDHYPVLGRFRLRVVDHPTSYQATDENSLNAALENVKMGDTIRLAEGTYTITKSITPDCSMTISGGWNASFTTQTSTSHLQLGSLTEPLVNILHYFNLTLDHLEISGVNSTATSGGAVVYSCGPELTIKDCYLHHNTTTKNGGAIVHKGENMLLSGCRFEYNSAVNGGAVWFQERDKVTIHDCRFIANNASTAGSAIEMVGCTILDIQRCAFNENAATTRGALDISPTSAPKAAHILNCVFLNNTLSAKKGLATATKRYGGAALWADMTANTIPLNIGLCTFMGNHTTFTGTADNFGGGALAVFRAKLCLMDNLILANDQAIAEDAPVWSDLYSVASDVNLWRDTYNLYSSSDEISGWENTIVDAFGGTLNNGQYIPKIKENGAYPIYHKQLGTYSIACLPTNQRLCESAFSYDLNGDGSTSGSVLNDMVNRQRNIQSCVGAVEYTGNDKPDDPDPDPTPDPDPDPDPTPDPEGGDEGLDQILNGKSENGKMIEDGHLIIIKNGIRYDAIGNRL